MLVVVGRRVVLLATTAAVWMFSGWLSRSKRALAQAEMEQVVMTVKADRRAAAEEDEVI